MAVPRRSSQHSSLQSPPRSAFLAAAPAASPPVALLSPAAGAPDTERECSGGAEAAAKASPDPVGPTPASSSSSSGLSSPASGAPSPSEGSSGIGGAFRELFEACRNGDVSRVKRLVDSVNVNAKDMAGRKSTPLHFAAGMRAAELPSWKP